MEDIFIHVLNISITASFLVLAIILYRLFAKKAPRWVSVLLWGLVGLRLLFPFNVESALSLIPSKATVPTTITQDRFPALDTGFGSIDEVVNPILSGRFEARPEYSANPMQIWITVLGWIWLGVMLLMLLYMAASFIYLRLMTRVKIEREENTYLCDYVKTPFILGIFKPRIYLPSDISDKDFSHVVAHERAHIKRLDHVWKPLGFLLLSVYWFNPLLWVAYILLCRDIESACDEKVISELDDTEKAAYSEALLSLGIKSRVISACPLAFGEVSVKSRVSAISKYKKPAAAAVAISLLVCAIFAACFLTYKRNRAVAIECGIWYAEKLIGSADPGTECDEVPFLAFTEGGDVLVESNDLSSLSYVRLGKMHTAYISLGEYEELLSGLTLRKGYGAEYFHGNVKKVWRIIPSVSSGIEHDEIYLFRTERDLYFGYSDGDSINALFELKFNEVLPTYLYTSKFVSEYNSGASLVIDTESRTGRVVFSGSSYSPTGSYVYENSRLIFTTDDDFALKLVFLDAGERLIFSEKDSDIKGLSGLFTDGTALFPFHQVYVGAHSTEFFDVNGDGKAELISVSLNVGEGGKLWYLVHSMGTTYANETVPFTKYDCAELEVIDGSLYLLCEYADKDLATYRYRITLEGDKLIFTEEK